jgi:hypothetical protein
VTFLNSFLAGFIALGAVPVIIHLLNRRRFRIVPWAAMEFLLATLEKNQRRIQLRDLIMMLLRTAAIVLLALALARPTIAPGGLAALGGGGDSVAVVVLDNSLSMGYHSAGETRFDVARGMARAVLESLPKNSSAALVLMSDVAVEEVPEPSHDLVFVGAEAQRAPLTDAGTDVLEGLACAWDILKDVPAAGREIYLVTDMQAVAWPEPGTPRWEQLVGAFAASRPRVKLHVLDAGGGGVENVSIGDLQAEDEIVTTDSSTAFNATVRNHGGQPAEDVVVDLYVGRPGEREMRKVATVGVDAVESVHSVRLETRFSSGGEYRVEARTGMDRLSGDNSAYESLDVLDRIRVLLIDGDPAEEGESYGGETDFLEAALSPVDYESPDWKSLIDTEVTTVYGLGGRNLRDYHAVILANVAEIPPALVEGLRTFVRADGRGLIVFLGDNVSPERYNELLCDRDDGAGLLPGRLGAGLVEEGDDGFGIATDSLVHPIVSFFAPKESRHYLARPRFFKAMRLELAAEAEDGAAPRRRDDAVDPTGPGGPTEEADDSVRVAATFTTGSPAAAERRLGRGSVLLFASTADKAWTDFPLRPAFLPVVKRAVQHVTLGRRPRKTVAVHERMTDFLSVRDAGAQVTVRDPRGGARQVSAAMAPRGDLALVEIPSPDFAGFYELTLTGDRSRTSHFAANPPRVESILDALDEKAVRAKYPNFEFQWFGRDSDLRRVMTEERVGKEIWPYLLAMVFACLVTETVLALKWAPKGK